MNLKNPVKILRGGIFFFLINRLGWINFERVGGTTGRHFERWFEEGQLEMRAPLWNETNKSQSQQKRRQVRRVLLAGWTMSETLLRMVWWRLDEALNAPTMTRGQTGSLCCVLHTIGDTKEANHSNDSAHFDNTRRRATWFKYSLDNNETIWNITAAGRCWTLLDAAGRCGHVVGLFHHSDWPNLYFQFIRQQLPRPSIVVFQRLGNVGWPLPDSSSTAAATPTQSTENSQFWFVNNGRVTWPITSVNSHVLTFQMGSIWKMWRPSFKQLVSQLDAIVGLIGFARATSSHLATFNCFSGFWVTHPMFAS